jgi:hypothetical protein
MEMTTAQHLAKPRGHGVPLRSLDSGITETIRHPLEMDVAEHVLLPSSHLRPGLLPT